MSTNTTVIEAEPRICEPGGSGLFLPLISGEQEWDPTLRLLLYLFGLLWCFMGVAIVADVFMAAIEEVTSKKKRILKDGSSAPEILLSVIELFSAEFYSGALGPSTIVGSAAFNLLCIVAVCVVAIPSGESRKVKDTSVFGVTATFSLWAYIWLIVILTFSSKDMVEPWEGALTFAFFPILVILAFLADIGYFSSNRKEATHKAVIAADLSQEELAAYVAKVRKQHGVELTDDQVMAIIEHETAQPKSRAAHRVAATREFTRGKKVKVKGEAKGEFSDVRKVYPNTMDDEEEYRTPDTKKNKSQILVEFAAERYSVLESCKECLIPIIKKGGDPGSVVTVRYSTNDGTAKSGQDYAATEGELVFKHTDQKHLIRIPIIDDAAYEEDEVFYVDIISVKVTGTSSSVAVGGERRRTTVTIIDDDLPGILSFDTDTLDIAEASEDKTHEIKVCRKQGSTGKISCRYYTENDSAIAPIDFEAKDGELEFENGQTSAVIEVLIKAKGRYEGSEMFRLYLSDPKNGAKFDKNTDGGEENNICSIQIHANAQQKQAVDKMSKLLKLNWDRARIGTSNWKDQFTNALSVHGGDDDASPSCSDYLMHLCSLPWKVFFALIPPTDYGGGWVCFGVALAFIGGVTAIIGDMAGLLGCVMDVPDSITAITFVALGTSLPDTFASKSAAVQDTYADASIGNVTGSNSVNVFLGLGLPWLIGSIYWHGNPTDDWKKTYPELSKIYPEGGFIVKSGDLGFSVTVFTIVAIICLGTLILRRKCCGAELGGAKGTKFASGAFFVCLWFVYVGLSSYNAIQSESR